jgi:excisionase family DNA binding protein
MQGAVPKQMFHHWVRKVYGVPMPSALMTVEEVSHRLHVTTKTVRRMAVDGRLKAIRLGGIWPNAKLLRFEADEVERALRHWREEEAT